MPLIVIGRNLEKQKSFSSPLWTYEDETLLLCSLTSLPFGVYLKVKREQNDPWQDNQQAVVDYMGA